MYLKTNLYKETKANIIPKTKDDTLNQYSNCSWNEAATAIVGVIVPKRVSINFEEFIYSRWLSLLNKNSYCDIYGFSFQAKLPL